MTRSYGPIWLTVLPRERRSRHPYQFQAFAALILCGISQLVLGPVSNSTLLKLPESQDVLLSWFCIVVGLGGTSAAFIPERVVTIWRWNLDMTWMRLWVELGSHGAVISVWASFFSSIQMTRPILDGLSITTALLLTMMPAAAWRVGQIAYTIKRATMNKPDPSAIVGSPRRKR